MKRHPVDVTGGKKEKRKKQSKVGSQEGLANVDPKSDEGRKQKGGSETKVLERRKEDGTGTSEKRGLREKEKMQATCKSQNVGRRPTRTPITKHKGNRERSSQKGKARERAGRSKATELEEKSANAHLLTKKEGNIFAINGYSKHHVGNVQGTAGPSLNEGVVARKTLRRRSGIELAKLGKEGERRCVNQANEGPRDQGGNVTD